MAAPVHIIGLGSPNGLDQVGWRLVDALGEYLPDEYFEPGLVVTGNCAAPALLPAMVADAERVLLVDALSGPHAAGAVCRIDPGELARFAGVASSHGIDLQQALLLLESLSVAPPRSIIFGIGTGVHATDNPESGIDTVTAAALPALVAAVETDIRTFLTARSLLPQAG
ncbi:MAG: hydrogenase maturation protease [Gammaproteobacteria bacterium]